MKRLWLICLFVFSNTLGAFALDVQEVTSKSGITAWLLEEPSIPFTALEIRFKGGTSLDRYGKRGEVTLMTGLLEEGAGDLDAQAFAQARDALAMRLGFGAYQDVVTVSAQFLTENREESLALLKSALTNPRFEEAAMERVKAQVFASLTNKETDPNDIASRAFYQRSFGTHPYGTDDTGTQESVAALTRDDMFLAFERAIARDRIYVSAVGDITADELGVLLDELFAELPKTGAPQEVDVTPALTKGIEVIPFETPQSVVLFGHEGLMRNDPDYILAYVANEILGGGGESRLMEEVRVKRGYTYGIGSFLMPMEHAALVMGQFASGNAVVADAIDVVRGEWAKIAEDGVTEEELAFMKTYLTGAYALRFDGNAPIARILVGMQMIGLDQSYITERNDLVNAITLEEINRVIARLYDPEKLHFTVVGQPEGL